MKQLSAMIHLDGALGEGGGQILRSALTLALVTGTPFVLENIRAGRGKPGLMAQHLAAVQAAAAVGNATVEGDRIGSKLLTFTPRTRLAGRFHCDVGTAGATGLVLQTIFLPLVLARRPSEVTLSGGTHVRWSPCHHYLAWHWLALLRRMGVTAEIELERAGFYPQGGGLIRAAIEPTARLLPLDLPRSGHLQRLRGISAVANLPLEIAERQRHQAIRGLKGLAVEADIELAELPAPSAGTMLLLLAEFEHSQACFFALGERGKRAEAVADEAVAELHDFLGGAAAVDPWLADQLLLPMALAEGNSLLTTSRVSHHLLTNAEILRRFLPVEIAIDGAEGEAGEVRVRGVALR